MITLYVKTHKITGLKYFGKTVAKDPHRYRGSGKYWRTHCKVHGFKFTTEIVKQFTTTKAALDFAIQFSKDNNIVESKEWANLKEEALDGGFVKHIHQTKEVKERRIESNKRMWANLSKEQLQQKTAHLRSKEAHDKAAQTLKDKWSNFSEEEKVKRLSHLHSPETTKKAAAARIGRIQSQETKNKISLKARERAAKKLLSRTPP